MRKAFTYRLYPNVNQARELDGMLETHRRLYNANLADRKESWEERQEARSYFDQATQFKQDRADNPYYARLNYSSAQATLRRVQKSFDNFFRRVKDGAEEPGYPRFKARGRFDSWTYPKHGDGCRLKDGLLRLQHVGLVKVKQHRPLEGEVKTITVKQEGGHWYVIASCLLPDPKPSVKDAPAIGIDVGIEAFLTLDTGERVENPRFLKKSLRQLRLKQRSLSRKKFRGKNYNKTRKSLGRLHAKVANQRKDFHHKTAKQLVDRAAVIAVESLNIKGMVKNRRLSRTIADVAWGNFLQILTHKAEGAGVQVAAVNARYTSQDCSGCGERVKKPLSQRQHVCPSCGLSVHRDHNAAKVILSRAMPEGVPLVSPNVDVRLHGSRSRLL